MKTLLGTISGLLFALNLQAQCTPGANYADSTFGAWPDTTTNFPQGYAGVYYETDLNFKVPTDAGDIDPDFAGNTIVNFTVDDVEGLPSEMSYACNVSDCLYAGGANGCAQISGTHPDAGTYNLTINITANLLIFGFPVPVPYSFEGYRITLNELAGTAKVEANELIIYPNPAKDLLSIVGEDLSKAELYNSQGMKLEVSGTGSTLSVSTLESGLYFIRIGGRTHSFVKE